MKYLDLFLDRNLLIVHLSVIDSVIWLGDFNWHHPMWEDDSNKQLFEPTEFITPLIDLLYKNKMLLVLPKGLPTFQTPAGNWTRPDNMWRCNTPDDPVTWCDVVPAICQPMADHLPIIVKLVLPLPKAPEAQSLDVRQADWPTVNIDLAQWLQDESPAIRINTEQDFLVKVDKVVHIINETLADHLKERCPGPFKCRWWVQELTFLKKKKQNRLSVKSYRLHHVRNHPVHAKHRSAANRSKDVMQETWNQDWTDWLELISQQDLYVHNIWTLQLFKCESPHPPYSHEQLSQHSRRQWLQSDSTRWILLSLLPHQCHMSHQVTNALPHLKASAVFHSQEFVK